MNQNLFILTYEKPITINVCEITSRLYNTQIHQVPAHDAW